MDEKKLSIFEEGQVLSFNKPLYWTSFDLVNKVRIIIRSGLNIKKIKVGHAGTLDPLASGLMIICTGRATKKIEEFRDLDKEYVATFHLGETTPSFDLETETDQSYPVGHITEEKVRKVLDGFIGAQDQLPPQYSAKMVDGKRAYENARNGKITSLAPVPVFFHEIELLNYNLPEVTVRLRCSKGTYIRSFARDLGLALESGAYLSALERTSIGGFKVKDSYSVEGFQEYVNTLKGQSKNIF